ncbi:MAG: hypothetical protein AB1646_11935 [Thermodesulfobacteriota bacterium]
MTISPDLAELLSEAAAKNRLDPLRGMTVGWESLKGVWDGNPHPIVWMTLPAGVESQAFSPYSYELFDPWDSFSSPHVREWKRTEKKEPLGQLVPELQRARDRQPNHLGLVKPYIVQEDGLENVPPTHVELFCILEAVNKALRKNGIQRDSSELDTDQC